MSKQRKRKDPEASKQRGRKDAEAQERCCPVCFHETGSLRTLQCSHEFCTPCIQNWIHAQFKEMQAATCPTCRELLCDTDLHLLAREEDQWLIAQYRDRVQPQCAARSWVRHLLFTLLTLFLGGGFLASGNVATRALLFGGLLWVASRLDFCSARTELSKLWSCRCCPQCRAPIYKDGGCPQMRCQCGNRFRWYAAPRYRPAPECYATCLVATVMLLCALSVFVNLTTVWHIVYTINCCLVDIAWHLLHACWSTCSLLWQLARLVFGTLVAVMFMTKWVATRVLWPVLSIGTRSIFSMLQLGLSTMNSIIVAALPTLWHLTVTAISTLQYLGTASLSAIKLVAALLVNYVLPGATLAAWSAFTGACWLWTGLVGLAGLLSGVLSSVASISASATTALSGGVRNYALPAVMLLFSSACGLSAGLLAGLSMLVSTLAGGAVVISGSVQSAVGIVV